MPDEAFINAAEGIMLADEIERLVASYPPKARGMIVGIAYGLLVGRTYPNRCADEFHDVVLKTFDTGVMLAEEPEARAKFKRKIADA